jgi:signal transduction histidine kinase
MGVRGEANLKKGLRGVLFSLLAFLLSSFGVVICAIMNNGFGSYMFAYEPATSGVYDAAKAEIPKASGTFSYLYLNGEWEFFHNRWVVSDNDTGPNDGYISLGDSWTKLGYPKEGYGSYRLSIKNLTPGLILKVEDVPFFEPCAFYIDGVFVGAYGFPGKTPATSKLVGRFRDSRLIDVPADGKLSFVMEMGYSYFGGMGNRPDFSLAAKPEDFASHAANPTLMFFNTLTLAGLVVIAVILSVAGTILVMGRGQKLDPSIFFFLLCLFLVFAFSYDGFILLETIAVSPLKRVMDVLLVFTLVPVGTSFLVMLSRTKLINLDTAKKGRWVYWSYVAISSLLCLATVLTLGYSVSAYLWGAALLLLLPGIVLAIKGCIEKIRGAWVPLVLFSLMIDLEITQYLDIEEFLLWKTLNVPSVAVITFAIVAFVIFIARTKQILKENAEKEEKAKRYEIAKLQALRGQIKPHFIFNCLSAIENTYHHSSEEGDQAMALFAEHLRSDVDSMDLSLIPFEEEIINVNHYLELENLRLTKKFVLLYDVDTTDFEVPPLSLQPLIENAIKYSKTNEKSDGFISLGSHLTSAGDVLLVVEDNGVGFDSGKIALHSQGLRNTAERFALILGATMAVESQPGVGTTISITIPAQSKQSGLSETKETAAI